MRLRGRKGIREAIEAQPELVVLNPEPYKGKWAEVFGNDRPIHVELGMGKGRFISQLSALNQHINYIGVDMYDELIRRASEKARESREEQGGDLSNLRLVRMNIESIENVFEAGEIERIYLNFSDPWPKKRHARRRLTHANFVKKYRTVLNERGEIHFKTDSRSLFEFSLNSFSDLGLRMRNISLDLHAEGPRTDLIMTEYETKFYEKGMPIHRLEVVIGEKALAEHLRQLEAGESGQE
ncbi:tRNA (guanosine(46)-N7)-methyltransferase TrmB [Paenibacillus naphthalenovorans]|uniref:tRNA (guanine-N(7)-)-methyltransferase n=1 Tax=Paenibacillus naphthalenovorans TaxID=162209 RepID=A0A0U2M7F5_9BACL|nr:tRNA (guanosine(46)-N7)-methyltransferase TrmB [Paenibacillus naphthalenovorans]ALS24080.1 tRNA (guanine-N7)-methyltransferase [Paenibacillus naphthalenovorans]GCL72298.1 tRNA (guanosine(46)-N7)-methyltransferase TrmB [Paenibacillus naphthalenovorans]SDJ21455.1 tRNA (guanine-N7-)-methyltransferase [Paenibacillus naphthalenovorans]